MEVIAVDVPELGNRSYIVHDGTVAVVIDPSRRISELMDRARQAGVTIGAVFETHIHNDYITGGYALARKLRVPYYVSAQDEVDFAREALVPEQVVTLGGLKITALASPGHTAHHLSYLVEEADGTPALFSGGSLLYGAVGRTDLVSAESTVPLARAQYQTAQYFVDRLPSSTLLYPTHGFGSFCAAVETEHVAVSTMAQQLRSNQAYRAKSEDAFVDELVSKLDAYPTYYTHMAPANLKGPLEPTLEAPQPLTPEAVLSALHTGTAIIDLRTRTAYAAQHMRGTYNIGLSSDLATYVGWLLAWDDPFILVAPTVEEVVVAQEQLSLIGRDIIAGQIRSTTLLSATQQTASYPIRTFQDLAAALPSDEILLLDVRRQSEWQKGHLPHTVHIPLHELVGRLVELPIKREIWVYCASGFRAGIAASVLSSKHRRVVLIDDSYTVVARAGLLPVEKRSFVDEVAAGRAQLLDVRNNLEWRTEHAQGAVHIPLGRLLDGDTGSLQTSDPVYVYCATGDRSDMAEDFLNEYGFQAINIGGLNEWVQAGGMIE